MSKSIETVEISIQGMHCVNCAKGVERHLEKMGVRPATVDFASASATIPAAAAERLPEIIGQINRLGYKASAKGTPAHPAHLFASTKAKFLFCLVFTLPLFLHMFIPLHALHAPYVQLALCLPVFAVGFWHFGRSALASLRAGLPNMDVLIAIGITASFGYSLTGTLLALGPDYLFYETTATITTLILFGNLLEKYSVQKTTSALQELSRLQARSARRIELHDGREEVREVEAEQAAAGDLFLVNTGDILPADGEVYWGRGSVDESMLTGEGIPVEKAAGDEVAAGSILKSGSIKIRALRVGEASALANIVRLVKEAQRNRPRIQRVGDKVAGVFVPVVIAISALTFLISYFALAVPAGEALLRAVAVLVIACPCAVGLATPSAIMVAIGRAARHGVLIRGGATLEKLAQVKTIIFDKTGTLTTGHFRVGISAAPGRSTEEIASIVHGLEKHSAHPIARSLVRELAAHPPALFHDLHESGGIGIQGRDSGERLYEIVSARACSDTPQAADQDLCVKEDGAPVAWLQLDDDLKTDALHTVDALRALGLRTVLLSGDRHRKVQHIKTSLGLDEAFSEKRPEEKLEIIEQHEQQASAAFVGDGINDAPALARASVGISLSDATGVAVQSAQVVLLGGTLSRLVEAVGISRLTLRIIQQNLFWAFFYNILAIPAAAAGYLNPMIAALTMGFSDVVVVANSLRLRGKTLMQQK